MPIPAPSSGANPTTVADLEARWRPLSDAEKTVAESLIGDAWEVLLARVPNLPDRQADGTVSASALVFVTSAMVLRVLKNPDGKRQESIDDYAWTRDQAVSSGALYVTDAEARLLGAVGGSGAFSIAPTNHSGTNGYWAAPDLWVPL